MASPTDPSGPSGRLLAVSDDQLSRIAGLSTPVPPGTAALLNASVGPAGIATHLELAHYVAQVTYESNYLRTFTEPPVPGRYEGRKDLGNTEPGDGQAYRGRGAIQLTGRYNYVAFNIWLNTTGFQPPGGDVVSTPESVSSEPLRFLAAAFYWQSRAGLRIAADNDDVAGVTSIITGARPPGLAQGLGQRTALTERAEVELG